MESSQKQFGLIVAYLLPGFVALGGISLLIPSVAGWLEPVRGEGGVGPPVYALLAATAAGMIVSCFRWLLMDHILAWTGIRQPPWNVKSLEERLAVFNYFVEYHYRYYQFYANTFIAILWTYALNRWFGASPLLGAGTDIGVLILCAVLFAGSRDALVKYYRRTRELTASPEFHPAPDNSAPSGDQRDSFARANDDLATRTDNASANRRLRQRQKSGIRR